MSRDYLSIGSSPAGEPCAQVGSPSYHETTRRECLAFINQLRRLFGPEPAGASLRMKAFPHDFGSYHEVVCYYDLVDSTAAADYAWRIEAETPENWDEEAKKQLASWDRADRDAERRGNDLAREIRSNPLGSAAARKADDDEGRDL